MGKIDIGTELGKKKKELICCCCGEVLKYQDFYPSNSKASLTRMDEKGNSRMIICKSCAQTIFSYLLKIYRTKVKALFYFCLTFDCYYNEGVAKNIDKKDTDNFLSAYLQYITTSDSYKDRGFIDSYKEAVSVLSSEISDTPSKGTEEEKLDLEDEKNLREIISLFHYDPFSKEPIEVRKKLYRDLVTMIDPAMVDDLVRQRAAIEIVRSFARIDAWTETINELSNDPQKMVKNSKEIKALIEAKNKETDMVTKFSKDHGFAERYATAKSRGTGTLSATIRDMEDFDFDDGKVNLYDIKTSASMQQAADISAAAIMKQLNLNEADYIDLLKTQREKLVETQQELERTKEELRLVYVEIKKQELLKELATQLKKKGMSKEEIYKAILAEIHFNEKEIKKDKKLDQFLLDNDSEV